MYYQSLLNENTPLIVHPQIEDVIIQKQSCCNFILEQLAILKNSGIQVAIPLKEQSSKLNFEEKERSLIEIYEHLIETEKGLINFYVELMSTLDTNKPVFKGLMKHIIKNTHSIELFENKISKIEVLMTA